MSCKKCKNIISYLNLSNEKYVSTNLDTWRGLIHENLLNYADYNNGVSEGGTGYACKDCFTFFEDHIHISMDEDEIGVELIDDIHEDNIESLAHFMILDEEAERVKESIKNKETLKVYSTSDLYVPHTFGYGTETEETFMVLEMHHKFGFNHERYSSYPSIDLSFEDMIRDIGTNDSYVKKTFLLTFHVDTKYIDVRASSSPYAASSVMISIDQYIEPKDIFLIEPETMNEIPLTAISLNDCKNRNHDEYLQWVRNKQNELKNDSTTLELQKKIEEKVKTIKSKM